jgi:hypothetical protein
MNMSKRIAASAVLASLVVGLCLTGCERGPMEKAGEKVDKATGQDKVIGKGAAEKAGKAIDKAVDDVKK